MCALNFAELHQHLVVH